MLLGAAAQWLCKANLMPVWVGEVKKALAPFRISRLRVRSKSV